VSETIGSAIEKHSERGPDTKFIDADGGLCLVTKDVMRRDLFKAANGQAVQDQSGQKRGWISGKSRTVHGWVLAYDLSHFGSGF
jgi:hypothetical protein